MPSFRHSAIRRLAPAIIAAGLALLTVLPLRAQPDPGAGTAVPPLAFSLKDQFDREYTQAWCAGRTAIMVVADREGSQFSGRWSKAIGQGLQSAGAPATAWVPVASLPSVPGFIRGFIKARFPQDKAQWTLMDWGGTLARAYHLEPKCCHILVFGPDGRLRHRASGRELDSAAVAAVVAAVGAASGAARGPGG